MAITIKSAAVIKFYIYQYSLDTYLSTSGDMDAHRHCIARYSLLALLFVRTLLPTILMQVVANLLNCAFNTYRTCNTYLFIFLQLIDLCRCATMRRECHRAPRLDIGDCLHLHIPSDIGAISLSPITRIF